MFDEVNTDFTPVLDMLRDAGVEMIGYVSTRRTDRPQAEIEANVRNYVTYYGDYISGIFFDEVSTRADQDNVEFYNRLCATSVAEGLTRTVLNPGTFPEQGWTTTCDVVVAFENAHNGGKSGEAWAERPLPSRLRNLGPERLAAIIHTADTTQMREVVPQAADRGYGYVYVTDDSIVVNTEHVVVEAPYDYAPTYWNEKVEAMENTRMLAERTDLTVEARWNLVGLPVTVPDASVEQLIPTYQAETLFGYQEGYQSRDVLSPLTGYWLRAQAQDAVTVWGERLAEPASLAVRPGWNLIAGLNCETTMRDDNNLLLEGTLFGYTSAGYTLATALEAGVGYWVRARQEGEVILECVGQASKRMGGQRLLEQRADAAGFGQIRFVRDGHAHTLWYGGRSDAEYDAAQYSVPPPSPDGRQLPRFLYQTANQNTVESRAVEATTVAAAQGAAVELRWDTARSAKLHVERQPERGQYQLITLDRDGQRATWPLTEGASVELNSQVLKAYVVQDASETPALPAVQHPTIAIYPNPSGHEATIEYQLPWSSQVWLSVTDVLGRTVAQLERGKTQRAGRHIISVPVHQWAAGVYVCRLQARGPEGGARHVDIRLIVAR